jgi:hypothetical protein
VTQRRLAEIEVALRRDDAAFVRRFDRRRGRRLPRVRTPPAQLTGTTVEIEDSRHPRG